MKISLAFVLISAISLSQAGRVPELDKCPPKPPTIAEFDTNAVHFHLKYLFELNEQRLLTLIIRKLVRFQYLGDWYTYATTPGFFQPTGTECQRAQYGLLPNGTVSVYNVAMFKGSGPGPGKRLLL